MKIRQIPLTPDTNDTGENIHPSDEPPRRHGITDPEEDEDVAPETEAEEEFEEDLETAEEGLKDES